MEDHMIRDTGSSRIRMLLFSGGFSLATTFDVLLDSYRDLADSERMKGNYFEQLVGRYSGEGRSSGPAVPERLVVEGLAGP